MTRSGSRRPAPRPAAKGGRRAQQRPAGGRGEAGALAAALLAWFETAQRPLPWRRGYDPYAVWVSETMLQQTQVDTVLPYFARWMARFPTIEAVAAAPEEDVLKLWEGLGYYARARNLHRAARQVVS
ncbi:MAG: A/G-specific adenine glycosylase, partial [Candidatus Lambdaproteobacteria bacterium]|nr:A/G-specific adenine glycosylase [Candidatus Lambdaproteobacteria bacterium]